MTLLDSGLATDDLDAYQGFALVTNKSELAGAERLGFLLLGLFGEVGSLLSELKKKQRDKAAYHAYAQSALEETGDVLWYLANVAEALGLRLSQVASGLDAADRPSSAPERPRLVRFSDLQPQDALFQEPASGAHVQRSLLRLAARAGRLVHRADPASPPEPSALRWDLVRVFDALVAATTDAHISLERAAQANREKVVDRWPIARQHTALFDAAYDVDEQLPRRLEVDFREKETRGTRYVIQSVNGVHLGDRLTDNSADQDDYRFHDVFHLAYAAVLGWSPVLRALLRLKRKSNKAGGR